MGPKYNKLMFSVSFGWLFYKFETESKLKPTELSEKKQMRNFER